MVDREIVTSFPRANCISPVIEDFERFESLGSSISKFVSLSPAIYTVNLPQLCRYPCCVIVALSDLPVICTFWFRR